MENRALRRLTVVAAFFAGLGGLIALVYFGFLKADPTCTDGRENGTEEGVDCGGVCVTPCRLPLSVVPLRERELAFIPAGNGSYDILLKLYNPNDEAGFPGFTYTVRLLDAGGGVLAEKSGTSYILPQETKYLFEFGLVTSGKPDHVAVEINPGTPERFEGYVEKPKLPILNQRHGKVTGGAGYYETYGLLYNDSPYDFNVIAIKVIARDKAGKPLAINATDKRDVLSRSQWDFRLYWPVAFPGLVDRVEMEADADVYHVDNFMKQYSPSGK